VLLTLSAFLLFIASCGSEDVSRDSVPAPWRLDPAVVAPTADALVLQVLVSDIGCASGRSADDHISKEATVEYETIEYGNAAVVVTFEAAPLSGPQTCPKPPPARRTVHLKQPVGTTKIVDGATHLVRYPSDAQPLP